MSKRFVVAVSFALATSVACGGISSPSQNKQEPFSGVLQVGGNAHFRVDVANGGEYSVRITQLTPTVTATVGVAWYQGGNCDFLQQQNYATLNTAALVGAIYQKGAYCVVIFDIGTLTVPQNFTLVVSHP
jgi:hypothetical protein